MPPGNRTRRSNRDRVRGGRPTPDKGAQPCGVRSTTSAADDEVEQLATDEVPKFLDANSRSVREEDLTVAICWICAEPVKYYSLSACNHRTCHVCALRLRVLYKKLECTFCKDPQLAVIFTTSPNADFLSYAPDTIPHKDSEHSIFFETKEMMKETLGLLRFNCPASECHYIASKWSDLKHHTQATHGKVFCDLCTQLKKVFVHEHALYTPSTLPWHLPSIRHPSQVSKQPPNVVIEGGVHPLCEFCNECFLGDDELFIHMRERHEECFLCKRNEIQNQHFQDYSSLELHFSRAHFVCADASCQDQKFIVFDSDLDLRAHRLEAHGKAMNAKEMKELRRVQVEFVPEDNSGGSNRGRGRDGVDQEPEPMTRAPQTDNVDASRSRDAVECDTTSRTQTVQGSSPIRSVSTIAMSPSKIANKSRAHDLVSTVWNVLDKNLHRTTSILDAFVEFLEEGEMKSDLLATWNGFQVDSEVYSHDPSNSSPTVAQSSRTARTGYTPDMVQAVPARSPPQLPRTTDLFAHATSSFLSLPSYATPTSVPPDPPPLDTRTFPPMYSGYMGASPTSPQLQQNKSWATVTAKWPVPKRVDEPTSTTQSQTQLPPGSSTCLGGAGELPSRLTRTWASLGAVEDNDLSAWTPTWSQLDRSGQETLASASTSDWTETTRQGKKGKGKQKQRVV